MIRCSPRRRSSAAPAATSARATIRRTFSLRSATVYRGGHSLAPEMAQKIAFLRVGAGEAGGSLSLREREVLRLLAKGKSMSEIAALINVSYKTVAVTLRRFARQVQRPHAHAADPHCGRAEDRLIRPRIVAFAFAARRLRRRKLARFRAFSILRIHRDTSELAQNRVAGERLRWNRSLRHTASDCFGASRPAVRRCRRATRGPLHVPPSDVDPVFPTAAGTGTEVRVLP